MRKIDAEYAEKILHDYAERLKSIRDVRDGLIAEECVNILSEVPAIDGWISVKDRLPDKELEELFDQYQMDSIEVNVSLRGYFLSTTLFYDGKQFTDVTGSDYTESVTHWMPMPKPPKED